jgi:glutamate--cysteine ligase
MAELRDISGELGVAWLGLGFHPLATQAQLPWIPKLRYGVMKDYLPTRGPRAHDMMRRTATVQANFDYTSEADAVRKMRVALALSPVISAMFANAPFYEGQATGDRSHRIAVWLGMDPDRSGLLPFAWEEDFGFQRYVEWALDVPMFMVQRGSEVVYNTGQTFRAFMAEGYGGTAATYDDWVTHLNTLFPEVRLKKTIEVRGADSQRTEMICALPALTKGFFYDERALAEAESLVSGLDHATVEGSRAGIARDGLSADFAGRPVQRWAEELLDIAAGGLARIGALDRHGNDERVHLKGIRALVEKGMTPADALVAKIAKEQPLLPQLLEHARL